MDVKLPLAASCSENPKYDAAAKLLMMHPKIIAPILQSVVEEYKGYSVEEIIGFIDKDSIRDDPVDDISAAVNIDTLPTELSSVSDKLIRYDVRFEAVNPRLTNEKLTFFLHIDIEVQNDYKPGYPIVKRGIYYAARDIGSQLGALSEETDYNRLCKAYSIWICNERIPENEQNTVSSYSIEKKDIIGSVNEPESDYDLMTVVIIRRGANAGEEQIFDYLHGIFNTDIARIEKYVDISDDEGLKKEVSAMSGLGQSIYDRGVLQGMQDGLLQGMQQGRVDERKDLIAQLLSAGVITPEQAKQFA